MGFCEYGSEPSGSDAGNFFASLRSIGVSRRTLLVEVVSLDSFRCREWNHDSFVVQPLSCCEWEERWAVHQRRDGTLDRFLTKVLR